MRPPRRAGSARRRLAAVVAACAALAGLSVLLQHTADFDPTAWLIWGRQLSEGELHTLGGPSWKPLPVLLTTPFALLGDGVAEALWLVVSRLGVLLALVVAYLLSRRLGGSRASGAIAAGGLVLAGGFLYDSARGDAEGLLVLLALSAVLAHVDGRRRTALLLAAGTGLIRPETWPAIAAYGLWLSYRDRRALPLAVLVGAGLLAAWLVPERIGSGDWLRAATRAQQPAPGSPARTPFPFGATVAGLGHVVPWPLLVGAVIAARRPPTPAVRWLVAIAALQVVIVALMAEGGFTGNSRYLLLSSGLLCVAGSLVLPDLARRVSRRLVWFAIASAVIIGGVLLGRDALLLAEEQRVYGDELAVAVAAAGGSDACAPIGADHFSRQRVAWLLRIRQEEVDTGIRVRRGTVFARQGTGAAAAALPPVRRRIGEWLVRWDCPD